MSRRIQSVATLTKFQDYRCVVHSGGANRKRVAMRRAEEAISALIRSRRSTHLLPHRPRVPAPESWSDPCVAVPVASRGVTWRWPPDLGVSPLYAASGDGTTLVMQAHETPKSLCRAVGLGCGCMVPWLGWGSLESCLRVFLRDFGCAVQSCCESGQQDSERLGDRKCRLAAGASMRCRSDIAALRSTGLTATLHCRG